ncbi:hypothetical protein FZW96_08055 [Bacillus sp. BGMRC 2118]|nr:hypothetical protein FZW96_08055 [Bacillus sp. BGMRC 2118]
MVFDGILIAIVIALFRGGSFTNLADMKLKAKWIFPVLLLVQIIIFITQGKFEFIGSFSNYIFILIYVVGLVFLWTNRHQHGFILIFFGVLLNFIVMAVNGGRMPVSEEAAIILDPSFVEALKSGLYGKHALITESTRLALLGDIIPLSAPYPKEQVISIGDVIMNVGVFIFIQKIMIKQRIRESKIEATL